VANAPLRIRWWTKTTYDWLARRPYLLLTLAVLATLGPFLAKPFNIDDPLFLWAARQIHAHPANPYGFDLNWYGFESPMWEVTKNPPLACYFLAGAAAVLGWSEVALHAAFLLPAIVAILGTYRLASRWCTRPLLAAFLTLLTPVFVISGTTVMCDMLLLALWVWAVVVWLDGLERAAHLRLAIAAMLVALAALTKYFGICLVPLLFVYGVVHQRRLGRWALWLLIPPAALAGYHFAGHAIYGKGLLADAGAYAVAVRAEDWSSTVATVLTALAFTGGCFAIVTILTAWLWRPRALAALALAGLLAGAAIVEIPALSPLAGLGASRRLLEVQLLVWATGGISLLTLAGAAMRRWRDPSSWLLASWTLGTFLFAGFVNWTMNARSLLPMAPAVGILMARRLSRSDLADQARRRPGIRLAFVTAVALTVWVARSDFLLATAVRESARQSYAKLEAPTGTLWFGGHWGFQYYLESYGKNARPVVNGQLRPQLGDVMAGPVNNTNVELPRASQFDAQEELAIEGPRWTTTFSREAGAGFYASVWGPLPFAFTRVPPEKVAVFRLLPSADITLVTADRADLDCAAEASIEGFHCGFASATTPWQADESVRLQPVYTWDRRLYLVPGLFAEPAISARYQTESPDKPRDQLKRFTANCRLRVIGPLARVRTRWEKSGTWSDPQDIPVGVISGCIIDG
jgi:4-amino-4-deoxy-L-arabinose transferase-like glycosyltransferase